MILYENTIERFNEDVMQNCIADKAAEKYMAHYRRKPGKSEYRSWAISLAILNNSFQYAGLKDNHVLVEYELPYSSKRIDVLLFGADSVNNENVVLLELKQWSNEEVRETETDGNIIVEGYRFGSKEQPHPSLQVEGYYFHLKDFVKIFSDKKAPRLSALTYAHNYSKISGSKTLYAKKFAEAIKQFPIFAKEESIELSRYLKDRLSGGRGKLLYERFTRSPIGPSKRLLDHTSEMINKRQIFNLIDEQIAAYNAILHKTKQLAHTKAKSVIIVKGGPGTGKSVITLEVMGELLRQNRKVVHATGSAAFTNTLRQIVGVRARNLFKFFNSFSGAGENEFDVLVCDEAHRIRESSSTRWTAKGKRTGEPQIDELIRVARLSIFLLDEYQVVRPNEIGSVALIKEAAEKFGVKDISEFELETQFRCSGSDAYLQWIDHVLDIRDTETTKFDKKMEFRIFDDPKKMMEEVRRKNKEKCNSSRIVAGFCWPWSNPNPDGSLVNDVKIGSFEMPWEPKDKFWKWATDESGMEQVGTVYTAQGFEFDYIAVIFGKDLVYRKSKEGWVSQPKESHDAMAKRGNNAFTKHLKNVYRVLLSRAHHGVYVYFMDKETEEYFRSHLPEIKK